MEKKPKVSPNDTYIFDDDDIEHFDELSMTSIMRDVTGLQKELQEELEEAQDADDSSSGLDGLEFGILNSDD